LTHVKGVPDVVVATERLMDAMTAGFVIQAHSLNVNCSIDISIFPEHGADCETLIKNADAAMYRAKEGGRNNFRFFAEDMSVDGVERLALEVAFVSYLFAALTLAHLARCAAAILFRLAADILCFGFGA
jgi:predicted signal transduction protein with EAL and GGDEF domain